MPTINFSFKDFCNLLGKKINEEELKNLLEYAKAEVEHSIGDEVSVKFNDTNQPYLWCPEGIATLLKGVLAKEKGVPNIKITKSNNKIIVDKSVLQARPYIAAFTAKGTKLTDYLLKQLIQLQEKLCDNYGRKRQKIAVGLYPAQKITFPIMYTAVAPDATKFIPLGATKEITLAQILEQHPKGKEYKWILENQDKYPLLIDAKKEILSFPPVINSEKTGKLEIGDNYIFFEATGTDQTAVNLAAIIFATALQARGFEITSTTIETPTKKTVSPLTETRKIKINKEHIKQMIGLELKDTEIKQLLEKARYNFSKFIVEIPPHRQDIMHENDILEDIAIMYGYNNIQALPITTFTRGQLLPKTTFENTLRQLLVGQGFQETFSAILSNKMVMQQKMLSKEDIVEIENFTTQTYSAVRNKILPILLEILKENKHNDYPQKIFEQGIITKKQGNAVKDEESLAIAIIHSTANFTEARQAVEAMLCLLGIYDFELKETENNSFVPGRAAEIIISAESIGIVGEIHPQVLSNFEIEMPVVAVEINVDKLFEKIKN